MVMAKNRYYRQIVVDVVYTIIYYKFYSDWNF
jgi:hypothetical protein